MTELKKELSGDLEDIITEYITHPLNYTIEILHGAINKRKVETVAEILFYSDPELLKYACQLRSYIMSLWN